MLPGAQTKSEKGDLQFRIVEIIAVQRTLVGDPLLAEIDILPERERRANPHLVRRRGIVHESGDGAEDMAEVRVRRARDLGPGLDPGLRLLIGTIIIEEAIHGEEEGNSFLLCVSLLDIFSFL